MTQKDIANLFSVDVSTINYHLKLIYKSEELSPNSTIGIFPIVRKLNYIKKLPVLCYQQNTGVPGTTNTTAI